MIISFSYPYPCGQNERWTEEAAKSMIGQSFKAKLDDEAIGIGTVLEAEVIDDGRMIYLTVEWPDDPTSQKILSQNKLVL